MEVKKGEGMAYRYRYQDHLEWPQGTKRKGPKQKKSRNWAIIFLNDNSEYDHTEAVTTWEYGDA
jgi:hypothetical protein